MIEAAAEATEELMDKYLNDGDLSEDEIIAGLRERTLKTEVIPVFCGTAFKNKGVQAMLDGVIQLLPSPADRPPVKGIDDDEKEDSRKASDTEPFSALAFKIMTDPFVGSLTFFRVYSGTLNSGDQVYNPVKSKKERVGRILQMHANNREEIKEVRAGDIAAAVGLKDVTTGDTLCAQDHDHHARAHDLPGAGHLDGGRAEDQVRPGKDGHRARSPGAGRSVVPRAYRRGIRPDHHRRHGRAAPRDPRRPHEARVQRRGERRQAAGRLSRDHPQVGQVRRQVRAPVGRQGPVRPRRGSRSSRRSAAAVTCSRTRSSAAWCRRNTSRRSTRASRKRSPTASWPVIRSSTSRYAWSTVRTTRSTRPKWRSRSPVRWASRKASTRPARCCSSRS